LANQNLLLVEGISDCLCIAELIGHHTHWPNDKKMAPVHIESAGGYQNMDSSYISTQYKTNGVKNFGIVIDADTDFHSRWSSLRNACLDISNSINASLPTSGLIHEIPEDGKRLGIWIMPNNLSIGMLETFLASLIDANNPLLNYAKDASRSAKVSHGAPYTSAHSDKATLHTWLAWQEPPGDPLNRAITKKILSPNSASATTFVEWFLNLFQLPSSNQSI